jgi:hypothetical protein
VLINQNFLLIIIGIKVLGCKHQFGIKYLELLNQRMKRQNRKILLLVDNAPVHSVSNPELLTNITIHYLPPNTTAHLQPADAGIINSFKVCIIHYL